MKARILAFLLAAGLLCGAAPLRAQAVGVGPAFTLASSYDLDSASLIYCNTTGVNNLVNGSARPGVNRVKTVGSSTTITSFDNAYDSFLVISVGDILYFNQQVGAGTADVYGTPAARVVTSDDSITVSAAIDLSNGATYNWRKLVCGTADTSGAFPVDDWRTTTIQIILSQENSASTDYQVERRNRGPASAWSIITGPTNDTSTFNDIFATDLPFGECRVGAKVNTDDGDDLTTNTERLTILVKGTK